MKSRHILFVALLMLLLLAVSAIHADPLVPLPPSFEIPNSIAVGASPALTWEAAATANVTRTENRDDTVIQYFAGFDDQASRPTEMILWCYTEGKLVQETPTSPIFMKASVAANCLTDGPIAVYAWIDTDQGGYTPRAHLLTNAGEVYLPWSFAETENVEYVVFASPYGKNYAVGTRWDLTPPVADNIPYGYPDKFDWDGTTHHAAAITTESAGKLLVYQLSSPDTPAALSVKVNGIPHTQGAQITGTATLELDALPEWIDRNSATAQIEYGDADNTIAVIPLYWLTDEQGCFHYGTDPRLAVQGGVAVYITTFYSCMDNAFVLFYEGWLGTIEGAAYLPKGQHTVATRLEKSSSWMFQNVYLILDGKMTFLDGAYDFNARSRPAPDSAFTIPVSFKERTYTEKGTKHFYKAKVQLNQAKVQLKQLWEMQFHGSANAPTLEATSSTVNGQPFTSSVKLKLNTSYTIKVPLTEYYNIAVLVFKTKSGIWLIESLDHYGFTGQATEGIVMKVKTSRQTTPADFRN